MKTAIRVGGPTTGGRDQFEVMLEAGATREGASMTVNEELHGEAGEDTIVLYGSYASYHTAKTRSYLRKKGIPVVERPPGDPRFRAHVRPTSGSHRIPQIELPGGDVVQDLRFERFFVLISTSPIGGHPFSRAERSALRDIRKQPVRIAGYAISSRRDGSELRKGVERWRAHVRIDRETFVQLRDFYLEQALRRRRGELESELREIPFEPYAPVRRQILSVLRKVNERRKLADLRPLHSSCLRFRRRQVRPFESDPGPEEGRTALGMLFCIGVLALGWRFDVLPWVIAGLLVFAIHRAR
jgi:hypothetical protein